MYGHATPVYDYSQTPGNPMEPNFAYYNASGEGHDSPLNVIQKDVQSLCQRQKIDNIQEEIDQITQYMQQGFPLASMTHRIDKTIADIQEMIEQWPLTSNSRGLLRAAIRLMHILRTQIKDRRKRIKMPSAVTFVTHV